MRDIPLRGAMIAWNDSKYGDGRVAVGPHPDDGWIDRLKLTYTDGACWAGWGVQKTDKLHTGILRIAWNLVIIYGVTPKNVHDAFSVIPEWREMFQK